MLPAAYTAALERLQDDVEPVDVEEIRGVVEAELGVRIRDVFAEFDDVPMAAASLAQTHRARTVTGRDVVVKVQRPGVRELVRDDIAVLEKVAGLLDDKTSMGDRIGVRRLLAQFSRAIADELDYRKESAQLQRFGELAADEELLLVPEPLPQLSTSRVLTMTAIEGRKITDLGPLGLLDIDGPALAEALFRFMLHTLLHEGLLHADPHPGNLLVTPDGRLGIIDLGMVAHVPRRIRSQLVRVLISISEGDGAHVAEILADMGHPRDDFDEEGFTTEVAHLVSGTLTLGPNLQAGTILVDLARISGMHGLRPPAEMTLVAKALLNLDRAVAHLDPKFDPSSAIRDNLVAVMGSEFSVSPGGVAQTALESKEFIAELPRRANRILDDLAAGALRLRIDAIDEDRLLAVGHRLVSRLTMGILLAAVTISAALMMGIEVGPTLFGYPALAVVFFLVAAVSALAMVAWIFITDRRAAKQQHGKKS
nr:AarF/ABC1/UbiB kinase family protein [Tessaracoccus sp. OS52]